MGDLRHAVKTFRRRPGFAFSAALLLALGIGANTAVFGVVYAVLLRPLPYADVDRLAFVWRGREPGHRHSILTGQHAIEIRQGATTLESFAMVKGWETALDGQIDLIQPQGSERLRGALVTSNFFELLGVKAATGRAFSTADGDAPVAVISDALWRRRFAGSPDVVGATLPFAVGRSARNAATYTVVGILPPGFRYTHPKDTDVYLVFPWSQVRRSRILEYQMVARLKPGVTAGQASAELTTLAGSVARTYGNIAPAEMEAFVAGQAMIAEPMMEHLRGEIRPGLMLLSAIAVLVLVIACVNLGLLMLSRTVDRRGELGLRAALGASRGRIVTQLLVESAVISVAGGAIALATVAVLQPVVRGLMPPIVPRADDISVVPAVLAFAVGLIALTAIVCGVGPAWLVLRRDLMAAVRTSASATTGDRGLLLVRRSIIALQVAVVVVLIVGSSLLLRSFWRLQHVDLGFRADDAITMEVRLLNPKYRKPGNIAAFQDALLTRIRTIPGVARAGLSTAVPMRGVDFLWIVGPPGKRGASANMRSVDPEFFGIMHLRLLAGRTFTASDTAESEPVAVVSESYGRKLFGTENPIGQALDMGGQRPTRIVGVVGDVRYAEASSEPAPAFYLPNTQRPIELVCVLVEPQPGAAAGVIDAVRDAVRAVDPEQPVQDLTTIGQILSQSTADRRFYALTTGAFALVALLLAIAGVFGVVSRTVTERRRELAIRVALGAAPRRLLRIVVAFGLIPAAFGAGAGIAGAFAGSRLLRGFLFNVGPTDFASYAGALVLVVAVALLACYLPARRVLRLQPMAVLKAD